MSERSPGGSYFAVRRDSVRRGFVGGSADRYMAWRPDFRLWQRIEFGLGRGGVLGAVGGPHGKSRWL